MGHIWQFYATNSPKSLQLESSYIDNFQSNFVSVNVYLLWCLENKRLINEKEMYTIHHRRLWKHKIRIIDIVRIHCRATWYIQLLVYLVFFILRQNIFWCLQEWYKNKLERSLLTSPKIIHLLHEIRLFGTRDMSSRNYVREAGFLKNMVWVFSKKSITYKLAHSWKTQFSDPFPMRCNWQNFAIKTFQT